MRASKKQQDTGTRTCPSCHGGGWWITGMEQRATPHPNYGTHAVIRERCGLCGGSGRVAK